MAALEETNVRVPPCALAALAIIAARRRVSRDEAVRQVLNEYAEAQDGLAPEDRLTHISTVLRYPAKPRWSGEPSTKWPTPHVLRLRVAPGVISRARSVALRLPGQSIRGHRDYQARSLTDAVITAIAMQEPFADEFLEGVLPLLRHNAALGLWKLAVATTSTAPENAIHDAAEEARSHVGTPAKQLDPSESAARHRLLLVAEALDEEVAWHSSTRFQVATNIARELLSGPDARANEQKLYEQRAEWNEFRLDLRVGGVARERYLQGISSYDWSGRGGSAVWRADRRVELQDFEEWLLSPTGPHPAARRVQPPGWLVRVPSTWRAVTLPVSKGMTEPYTTWVAAGKLLVFPIGHKQVVWPLKRGTGASGPVPVPGIEPLLAAAGGLRPDQVSAFIEAALVDWNDEGSDEYKHLGSPFRLRLPANEAFELGLIDADERRESMARARAATLNEMAEIISGLPEDQRQNREALKKVKGNARQFGHLAKQLGIDFTVTRATWLWPGQSVADEVVAGARAGVVQWLASAARKACARALQHSMEQAWHASFDHRPADHWVSASSARWEASTPGVTPTSTDRAPSSFEMEVESDLPF
ncbi:hypothetical protein ABZV78_29620 [Micromonospora sp. NPDC004540]|uniref:hypothetical protein n=1 Tax=Micromonospora sp. NPDC004540 TaxID=3154457 RepID=UPI0033A78FA8